MSAQLSHPPASAAKSNQTSPSPANSRKQQVTVKQSPESAKVNTLLRSVNNSMERSGPEYSQQSGLPSPYPSNSGDSQSEASFADQAPPAAAQPPPQPASYSAHPAQQQAQQEARSNYSTSATPTSDYSAIPQSARSSNFPEQQHQSQHAQQQQQHIPRPYYPTNGHGGSTGGGMAQTPTSPSSGPIPSDGPPSHHDPQGNKSDSDVPIDPSIAAPSPTYATHQQQYSPYAAPPHEMHQTYQQHPGGPALYPQQRPDWTGYGGHPQQHPGHLPPGQQHFPPHPNAAQQQRPSQQVYSFVPIPGAQQHKRPRRRYEEIERMYKCGWNGCEKAYGTLNHLNAHVTMQSHGTKRTPEEFKEIRKEWKARKKEEEAQRKADEERARHAQAGVQQNGEQPPQDGHQPPTSYPGSRPVQLPPIGYAPSPQGYPAPPQPGVQPVQDYNAPHMYPPQGYQPQSPYGAPNQPPQMYNQQHAGPPTH